jgi:hypothetical protein
MSESQTYMQNCIKDMSILQNRVREDVDNIKVKIADLIDF